MQEMVKFVSSGTSAARSMYGILNRAEAWYRGFRDNEAEARQRAEILEKGVNAFFWHLSNVVEQDEEVKRIGIESIQQIVSQNPAVLYIAMEQLCEMCDGAAAEDVMANFEDEWREMTGEKGLGAGYSKARAMKKLQTVRELFGLQKPTATLH